jgi:hypothetical protein
VIVAAANAVARAAARDWEGSGTAVGESALSRERVHDVTVGSSPPPMRSATKSVHVPSAGNDWKPEKKLVREEESVTR